MDVAKYINDPIHGHIPLDNTQLAFIDTVHFQRFLIYYKNSKFSLTLPPHRLRDLKQLGTAYYVFPGACHNRFEHSIGVSYLCERMLQQLKLNDKGNVQDLREEDEMCVKIAGLTHDLGTRIIPSNTFSFTFYYL